MTHFGIHRHARLGSAALSALMIAGAALLPTVPCLAAEAGYVEKPATWRNLLVDKDFKAIYDSELAAWVKAAQTSAAAARPARSFDLILTFQQCFGGGFLTELEKAGVKDFRANAASRYDQPATYDLANDRSHYSFAWSAYLADDLWDDKEITDFCVDALVNGDLPYEIPANPWAAFESPQYRASAGTDPALVGHDAHHNYAILFAGSPETMDFSDLNLLYATLVVDLGFDPDDIRILYGDQELFDGVKATRANLESTWKTWLVDRIKAQPVDHRTAHVFFWAGDHGNAEPPLGMSVAAGSQGQAGSAVKAAANPENGVYETGGATNVLVWDATVDVDAMSFGDDLDSYAMQSILPPAEVYFSVDTMSNGADKSDVRRERDNARSPAPDVFAMTDRSNRQFTDGGRSLGLQEPADGNEDDLDALEIRNISALFDAVQGMWRRPFFYSVRGSSTIMVQDPKFAAPYEYLNFANHFVRVNDAGQLVPDPPKELDALAMFDDCVRFLNPDDPEDPNNGKLFYDPMVDEVIFSIGRTETTMRWTAFAACDVLRLHLNAGLGNLEAQRFRSCEDMGLVPPDPNDPDADFDNVDGLDLNMLVDGTTAPLKLDADPEDLDGDGDVDGSDLGMLLAAWGPCPQTCICAFDLNGDGQIDGADLALLLAAWSGD